jgi:hypothetical protein
MSVFDLSECLTELLLRLHLMPTQQMDNAIAIEEIEAKPLGVAPLPTPQRPLGPLPAWTWPVGRVPQLCG